jgi:dephospho-CoA kinase
MKVAKVISGEKGKNLLVIKGFKFRFQKILADSNERWYCTKKCKCYIKCKESREIFGKNVMHNHHAYSEACLNRQILNNSVKRKAMENFSERPRKLIHKELQNQYMDTLTYKDIRYVSRNMHKARSFQLLPLSTDIEETHEALSAVRVHVQTSSKEQFLLVNDSKKIL